MANNGTLGFTEEKELKNYSNFVIVLVMLIMTVAVTVGTIVTICLLRRIDKRHASAVKTTNLKNCGLTGGEFQVSVQQDKKLSVTCSVEETQIHLPCVNHMFLKFPKRPKREDADALEDTDDRQCLEERWIKSDNETLPMPLANNSGQNLCFANAMLQCLRMTQIEQILNSDRLKGNNFLTALQIFICNKEASAEKLCIEMEKVWRTYRVGQQEDAHEFLTKVLENIYGSLRQPHELQHRQMFKGTFETTVTCSSCKRASITMESFSGISLSLKDVDDLDEACNNYFAAEMLERYYCYCCKQNGNALKSLKILEVPNNLILHINRFTTDGKQNQLVKAPFILQLQNHVVSGKKLEDNFKLFAAVNHYGRTTTSGHYIAYVEMGNKWFIADDMNVSEITDVSKTIQQAYILFYKRDTMAN